MKHLHKAIPSKSRDICWQNCTTPTQCAAQPRRQVAHGNITRVDQCSCGATRETEINAGRSNYGLWKEAQS